MQPTISKSDARHAAYLCLCCLATYHIATPGISGKSTSAHGDSFRINTPPTFFPSQPPSRSKPTGTRTRSLVLLNAMWLQNNVWPFLRWFRVELSAELCTMSPCGHPARESSPAPNQTLLLKVPLFWGVLPFLSLQLIHS